MGARYPLPFSTPLTSPPLRSSQDDEGVQVAADYPEFSGFIFKMQANLDPQHRDRLAYVRVISGKYEKGMKVKHSRSKPSKTYSLAGEGIVQGTKPQSAAIITSLA